MSHLNIDRGRSAPVSTSRRAHHLFRSFAAAASSRACAQHQSAIEPVGLRHQRRLADPGRAIERDEDLPIGAKLVRGHEYLHYKGLKIDLVILNDNPTTYLQSLQKELETMIRTSGCRACRTNPAAFFCVARIRCRKAIAFCFTPWRGR